MFWLNRIKSCQTVTKSFLLQNSLMGVDTSPSPTVWDGFFPRSAGHWSAKKKRRAMLGATDRPQTWYEVGQGGRVIRAPTVRDGHFTVGERIALPQTSYRVGHNGEQSQDLLPLTEAGFRAILTVLI